MKIWFNLHPDPQIARRNHADNAQRMHDGSEDCLDDCESAFRSKIEISGDYGNRQPCFPHKSEGSVKKDDEHSDYGEDCGDDDDGGEGDEWKSFHLINSNGDRGLFDCSKDPELFRLVSHHLQLLQSLYVQSCKVSHWLICNPTESGKITVVDEEALAVLENFRVPTTLQDLAEEKGLSIAQLLRVVAIFVDLGFLVDCDQGPVVCEQKAGAATLSAWLHVTNACNLRCSYCYVAKSSERMGRETARRAVDAVLRSALRHGYGRVHFKYAGGEAMLQLPEVLAVHDYAVRQGEEHGVQVSGGVLSNGTIMTPRMIEQLKKRRIRVMISLDGVGEVHDRQRSYMDGRAGSFATVERTIARLLAGGLRPSINVTVSQRNIAGLPALLAYMLERDLRFTLSYYRENDCSASIADLQFSEQQMIEGMRTAFAYIEEHLPGRRIIDSLLDKGNMRAPHHYTCGIGRNYLVINQRGEVGEVSGGYRVDGDDD